MPEAGSAPAQRSTSRVLSGQSPSAPVPFSHLKHRANSRHHPCPLLVLVVHSKIQRVSGRDRSLKLKALWKSGGCLVYTDSWKQLRKQVHVVVILPAVCLRCNSELYFTSIVVKCKNGQRKTLSPSSPLPGSVASNLNLCTDWLGPWAGRSHLCLSFLICEIGILTGLASWDPCEN